jgi:outer membrane receptor protein involved in Fe transport
VVPTLSISTPSKNISAAAVVWLAIYFLTLSGLAAQDEPSKKKEKKEIKIAEEITVIGQAPRETPLASVTRLNSEDMERLKPRDLGQALALAPGLSLTVGQKNETILLIRGMDARRIVLLLDGIPVYEPYFSSFDLKTFLAGDIDSIQITKGPASVLYGPNVLAGLVNVVTGRPGDRPSFSLNGSYGQADNRSAGFRGGFRWRRLALSGSALYQDSEGFYYPDSSGSRSLRSLSDYRRYNLSAKIYYYPTENSEILVSGSLYSSAYSLPPALEVQKPRYWRFKNWDRSSISAGGFLGLGPRFLLRFRAYLVHYDNTLEQFQDSQLQTLQAVSTFDNSVMGFFGLAELGLAGDHTLKLSLSYQADQAKTRDDTGLPWQSFDQATLSGAAEGHLRLARSLSFITGLSLDRLHKHVGPAEIRANPLAGLRLTPLQGLDLSLSVARKSRFPSMRSLYSASNGNPDLLSEEGLAYQLDGRFERWAVFELSAFLYEFKDMIDSLLLPDGTRRYINIGRAYIRGLEVGMRKDTGRLSASFNYTFLAHRNLTDERPLDIIPRHLFQANASWAPLGRLRLTVLGTAASSSSWYDSSRQASLNIPSYFYLDAVLSLGGDWGEVYLKAVNVFNRSFFTEPGFPWPGRTLEMGFRMAILR